MAADAGSVAHIHSDATQAGFTVSCEMGPLHHDYRAETASGIKLTDPYAVERGADKGLVKLMNEGGRRVKHFTVPHRSIRAIIDVRADETVPDRVDLVFMPSDLLVFHTSTSNAGIFTGTDVYVLGYRPDGVADQTPVKDDPEAADMLNLGLRFYDSAGRKCRS